MKYGHHVSTALQTPRLLQARVDGEKTAWNVRFSVRGPNPSREACASRRCPFEVQYNNTARDSARLWGSAGIPLPLCGDWYNDLHHPRKCLAVLPARGPARHQPLLGIDSTTAGFCLQIRALSML
jgi:hypothetical protein